MITKAELEQMAIEYDRSLKTHPCSAVELRKDLVEFAEMVVKKLNIPIVSNSVYCDCDNPTKYTDANNDTYCSWCGKDFKQ